MVPGPPLEVDRVLNVQGFDLDRILELEPHFLKDKKREHSHDCNHEHCDHPDHHHDEDIPDHVHDADINSVGITIPGDLNAKKLNEWIMKLLAEDGPNIFRMKGVLSLKGDPNRFIFQGVHMMIDSRSDRPWGKDARGNKLIVIGRNLDREKLVAGFRSCLA